MFQLRVLVACYIGAWLLVGCESPHDQEVDRLILLDMHEQLLEAHHLNDVSAWMDVEGEVYVFVNAGRISFPTKDERRAKRELYLKNTSFSVYRYCFKPADGMRFLCG